MMKESRIGGRSLEEMNRSLPAVCNMHLDVIPQYFVYTASGSWTRRFSIGVRSRDGAHLIQRWAPGDKLGASSAGGVNAGVCWFQWRQLTTFSFH